MRRLPADKPIPVIDLFAGPGGLGEGFSSCRDRKRQPAFRIRLSIEKDRGAHRTLRIRAFYRQFAERKVPRAYYEFLRGEITEEAMYDAHPDEARAADAEAMCGALGELRPHELRAMIEGALGDASVWVLIGGPPCQAYSLAGRSRNKGKPEYLLETDEKHRLYREYLRIVASQWPPVFVMENVKGLLSATVHNERLFERICKDLSNPGRAVGKTVEHQYRVLPLTQDLECEGVSDQLSPKRFVICAERHGVPQARHRVILLGVRDDLGDVAPRPLQEQMQIPVARVLHGLPRIRSGRSQGDDSAEHWKAILKQATRTEWFATMNGQAGPAVQAAIRDVLKALRRPQAGRGREFIPGKVRVGYQPRWYLDNQIGGVCNHAARTHMDSDLHRYLFAVCFAREHKRSPLLREFPPELLPAHANVAEALDGGYFDDRFRVQVSSRPATTITSHISKDGHYYIHPDPLQCRSLTVREAARIQTFPDNYFFAGNRTGQYTQVGNAVPPLLAREIAKTVLDILRRSGMIE
jgi:DNA (cytosine-5)-methyltransferase 1